MNVNLTNIKHAWKNMKILSTIMVSLTLGIFVNPLFGQVNSVLGVDVGSMIVIAGDSFASDTGASSFYPNPHGDDWPVSLQDAGYDIHIHAIPGYRLGFHILEGGLNGTSFPTWESHLASATDPELIIIAAGLNDLLVRYASFDVGGPYEDRSLQQYFDPGNDGDSFSRFRSTLLWNVGRVLIERAVAEAKEAHPGVPILLFNIPPFELFRPGIVLRQNGDSLNQWIETEAVQLGVTVFDMDGFMRDVENGGGYPFNTSDDLHPSQETQNRLVSELTLPRVLSPYFIGPPIFFGDVNRDGVINFIDILAFIGALSSGEYQMEADTNQDGFVDFSDIAPFIQILR